MEEEGSMKEMNDDPGRPKYENNLNNPLKQTANSSYPIKTSGSMHPTVLTSPVRKTIGSDIPKDVIGTFFSVFFYFSR